MRKRHYFSYHSESRKEEKILHQRHEFYTLELPLIKLGENKYCNLKIVHFEKKDQKIKTFLHVMTTFHNFAIKIETG